MKTKLSLSILLSLIFGLSSSQIPQGFNYQAIARDGAGAVLPNAPLQVMIYIQSSSSGGTLFWKELHSPVTTNAFGLFNVVVGNGTRQSESTTATFDLIDWTVTPKYLKTEIYYSGSWKDMGTTQLYAVPYAMTARNLTGTAKLGITGTTSNLEEALFEVRNKDGQTVFAVYNEGVRIYVSDGAKAVKGGFAVGGFGTDKAESTKYLFVGKDSVRIYLDTNPLTKGKKSGFAVGGYDITKGLIQNYLDVSSDSVRIYIDSNPDTKKVKGGFAVGGYDMTKGNIQNYLDVSSDSVRIYIDSNPDTKKVKGGFAVGGYDMTKGITGDYFNVSGKSDAEAINGESRVLWYPAKEAFRSGNVLIESKDSVGLNSWASGYRSKAIGNYSQALGYQAIARKDYSTAIGKNAIASKINSFAFGEDATAKNAESYAIGRGAIAEGFRSFAFGSAGLDSIGNPTGVAYAKGNYSFAIGQGSQALGEGAFTLGLADSAKGDYSTAIGYENLASGWVSTTMGFRTKALGVGSTAMGKETIASGYFSTAIGQETTASANFCTAMGLRTTASKDYATAMGRETNASGRSSIAMGELSAASGEYSTAMGYGSNASGESSIAMGKITTASGYSSTAMGYQTTASQLYSTAMGYKTTASGYSSTAMGQETIASNSWSTAMGSKTIASGNQSTAMGSWATASGYTSTAMGSSTIASGDGSTAMGNSTKANTKVMIAMGIYNDTTKYHGNSSFISWYDDDPLFVIGKGQGPSERSNAVTVLKSGRVGLQTVLTPTYALELPNSSTIGIGQARAYSWATYSDGRAKSGQTVLSYGINEIMQLSPSEYFHHSTFTNENGIEINKEGTHDIGLIAQDVYNIIPEAVNKPENEEKELWSISYDKLVPVLINAVKQQQQQIEVQNQRIDQLIVVIDELKKEIASSLRSSQ